MAPGLCRTTPMRPVYSDTMRKTPAGVQEVENEFASFAVYYLL